MADAAIEADEGHADEAAELTALAGQRGKITNSATETYTLGAGLGLITDGGSLGFSVGYFDTLYGVPERPGAAHAHGEEESTAEEDAHGEAPVTIDMRQYRADMRASLTPRGAVIDAVTLRLGFADYKHIEFEGDEVGTTFLSKGLEGRLEIAQAEIGGLRGVIGAQGAVRDFEAIGEEAFVPANTSHSFGVFTLQEYTAGKFSAEGAVRFDHVRLKTDAITREFDTLSGAVGVAYEFAPFLKAGVNLSLSQRAPTAEELFSNGPHIATAAFEIGNPALAKEKSTGVEFYLRGRVGPLHVSAAAYHTDFKDYIYELPTGAEEDGLPVYEYRQGGARYTGFEIDFGADIYQRDGVTVSVHGVADYVRATLKDGDGPVPRIPPLRLLGGVDVALGDFRVGGEVEWAAKQNRVAAFETETAGHTVANASLSWKFLGSKSESVIILSADNIFDVEARRHASFTKDFVPMAGRDIRVGVRLSF